MTKILQAKLICEKCLKEFPEKEMELSHDIPKYLGGTDKDGRHWLCVDCHDEYERMILSRCCLKFFKILIPYTRDRRKYIPYMNKLKKIISNKKNDMVLQIKEEFYLKRIKDGDTETTAE